MEMRYLILLAIFASELGAQVPGPTTLETAATEGDVENGKNLFMNRGCFHCHNTLAHGGRAGPRLAPEPLPYGVFSNLVRRPLSQMPPYTAGVMSDEELEDIYAFLLSIPPPQPVSDIPLLNRE